MTRGGCDDFPVWTIYHGATDMPAGAWRVRRRAITSAGIVNDTECTDYPSLEEARKLLIYAGLYRIGRHPSDPPCIVELWL